VSLGLCGLWLAPDLAWAEPITQSPGSSSTTQVPGADWGLSISATASSAEVAAGVCVDSYFDWDVVATAGGAVRHYDARVVRNCDMGVLTRSKWADDTTGLTITGVHKAGGCLVVGTDSLGRWGTRINCEVSFGMPVASCGTKSAACYIRKNGVITKTGWTLPQNAAL
jgi:hypothetical protein